MGYVQKVLQPNETIVYQTALSWAMYIPGLLVLVLAIIVFVVAGTVFNAALWANVIGAAVLAVALYLLGAAWFQRWTTEIAITDRRVILKRGFIRRDTIEMSVEKVESVDVNQSLLGRLLDYGDIVVRGTGAGLAPLRKIDAPLAFRSHITGLVARPPAATPPGQVPQHD